MSGAATQRARQAAQRVGLRPASIDPIAVGLINLTFRVGTDTGESFIVQRVNPVFSARVHENIEAVTAHLRAKGLASPTLLRARDDGRPWVELEGEIWRVMTIVDGVTFDRAREPAQSRAAAQFLGRWHEALHDLDHEFVGMRVGVHDTAKHLEHLARVLDSHAGGHRLAASVRPVAEQILDAAAALPVLGSRAPTIGHGDPKLNNLVFAGRDGDASRTPVAWIDLDTVGPISLAHELGDMWRSWCNVAGENEDRARLDLEIFAASAQGYLAGRAQVPHDVGELALGLDWISVELAARFCADALTESYFGWNPDRFPSRGDHNLQRARGQLSLHLAAVETRTQRADLLRRAAAPSQT